MDPDLDRFTSRRSTVYAPEGAVATSQPLAAEAGAGILRSGGDAFALFRTADGEVGAMRSCGGAPADATIDGVREAVVESEGVDPAAATMPFRGPHAVTVLGTARGWEATVERFGRLPLADVLEPAIGYAVDGYPVTEVVAAQWEHGDDLFAHDHAREALPGNSSGRTR